VLGVERSAQFEKGSQMIWRGFRVLGPATCAVFLWAVAATAAIEVLHASFRPDRMLPEYNALWKGGYKWGDTIPPCYVGGAIVVYMRNAGAASVTIGDFVINGTGLANGINCKEDKLYRCDQMACSVYYPSVKQALVDAGEPIWWRVDQNPIPPGGTAEIFVRMRKRVVGTLSCTIVPTSGSTVPISISVTENEVPRVAGQGLSPDYATLYLYLRHPTKGKLPTQILVDGVDRTSNCTIGGDAGYDLLPVVCNMPSAFSRGTFHSFQAVYDDGTQASAGLRVYYDDFKHGRWGSVPAASIEDQRFHLIDMGVHSMNIQTQGFGDLSDITKTAEGHAIMDQYGIKKINDAGADRLYSIFLCDEPDAGEGNIPTSVSPYQVGALAQSLANKSQYWKMNYATYPTNLNMNGSFKPYNYYVYGHVADILSVDPYYQTRIVDSYWYYPQQIPWYTKATYVYAVGSTCKASCEPNRLHMIINSCRKHDGTRVFRWATPEEKRIEFYYALAAGAQEISYWWFSRIGTTVEGFCGIGDADEPGSAALWREMGLLGAEAGIASPVIVNSCPADVAISKPGRLWTRALLSGNKTIVLLCVNDDYACNEAGTIIRAVQDAEVSLDLPSWVTSPTNVFEVDYKGIRDVSYGVTGGRIDLHLGTVEVTRMIVITSDSTLKNTLQSRYTSTYGPRVAQLVPTP
jgi:hypothetical protein